jgi:hypothetical protein
MLLLLLKLGMPFGLNFGPGGNRSPIENLELASGR